MVGSQVSLAVGLITATIVMLLGVGIGLLIGYLRGVVDAIFALIINVFYGVPPLMIAIVLYVLLGPGLINIIIAIAAVSWMDMARLVRGQTLSIREREFIEAARAGGARTGRILFGPHLPQRPGADHRADHLRGPRRHPHLGVLQLPRLRGPRPPGGLGRHGQRGLLPADRRIRPLHPALARRSPSRSPCWPSTSSATACATPSTRGSDADGSDRRATRCST